MKNTKISYVAPSFKTVVPVLRTRICEISPENGLTEAVGTTDGGSMD